MKRNFGMTLIEITISAGLLSIISILGFLALQSSVKSSSLAFAQNQIDSALRDTFNELTNIVKQAYTSLSTDVTPPIAPQGVEPIQVINEGRGLRFYIPVRVNTPAFFQSSGPILITYENEDIGNETNPPNGILDPGEDTNNDGVLNRRLIIQQGNTTRVIGSTNCISDVRFELLSDRSDTSNQLTVLYVYLEGTMRIGPGEGPLIRSELSGTIKLEN